MKIILIALALFSSAAFAAEKPLTLHCTENYSTWKSLDDPIDPSQEVKLPVIEKLRKSKNGKRYQIQAARTTPDGRYQITVEAFQPLKGDVMTAKLVRIHVLDTVSKTSIQDAYPDSQVPGKDVLTASQLVTWNMDREQPNQPGSQLKVVCELQ